MQKGDQSEGNLQWWQLSLIGVGCIIGTGYFLGSSIAIKMTGPSVIIAFTLAAIGNYIVFNSLAKMTADHPEKGSFRTYAKQAFGRSVGFGSGWVYWLSEMLIVGSQLTALSIFSRFWFQNTPLWVFASIYAILGILVMMIGTKGFEKLEDLFAVIKVAAILMFIIIAIIALSGVLNKPADPQIPTSIGEFFPEGATGLWSALIFAFYAFGGIEIMGLMSMQLKNKEDAPKSGKIMLLLLGVIYVASLGLALVLVSWDTFNQKESPFITALGGFDLPFFPHVFTGAMIIAGFSTMVASLFATTNILVTLAEEGDAPSFFSKKWKDKIALPSLGLTTVGVIISIVLSLLMPEKVYGYITTAAGLMLLYNWLLILLSSGRLLKLTGWDQGKRWFGVVLLLVAASGTLVDSSSRAGFFVSLAFILVIGLVILKMRSVWKHQEEGATQKE
ncbi:amino acid permease [Bacillus fonticola]|uniref:amino acid permease n=1 Tax=Bacillus fonticola TaxID=2728853 RepID=UPI001D149856|nr:amino acid permease [Bacillus fonticola]